MKTNQKTKEPQKNDFSLRRRAAESLGAAKEVILNAPRLVFVGKAEVTVENYRCILEYTDKKILINTNNFIICLCGENLELRCISREMLYVTGCIDSMEYRKGV